MTNTSATEHMTTNFVAPAAEVCGDRKQLSDCVRELYHGGFCRSADGEGVEEKPRDVIKLVATTTPDGAPQSFGFSIGFATQAQAHSFAARFPKSCRMRVWGLSGSAEHTALVRADAGLCGNGVNGGVNETGVKRYHAVVRACSKLDVAVTYATPYGNSYPTRAAFEAAIS